jgi:ankyrin repeat protein
MAQTCLTYLLHFKEPNILDSINVETFPLARYAAEFWIKHTRAINGDSSQTNLLAIQLLESVEDAFISWIRLCDPENPCNGLQMEKLRERIAPPLYYASNAGLFEPARLLVENGADVNAKGGGFCYALIAAALNGHKTTAQLLLENGAKIDIGGAFGKTALHLAAGKGYSTTVQLLLEYGANIEAEDEYHDTALHFAAKGGHKTTTQLLLKKGARVDVEGRSHNTALHLAAQMGRSTTVQLLLDHGANCMAVNKDKWTALHIAASQGHLEPVSQLLEKGADVNARTKTGNTALHIMAKGGTVAVASLLLEKGADINARAKHGRTPILEAAMNGHHTLVYLFGMKGADIDARDDDGSTVLHLAVRGWKPRKIFDLVRGYKLLGHKKVLQILLDMGSEPNNLDRWGRTPPSLAAKRHEDLVRPLLDNGADPDVVKLEDLNPNWTLVEKRVLDRGRIRRGDCESYTEFLVKEFLLPRQNISSDAIRILIRDAQAKKRNRIPETEGGQAGRSEIDAGVDHDLLPSAMPPS